MTLPALYKYLDVNGAKLTLGNGNFRHAKPSSFNDVEDMTVQDIFPEKLDDALKILSNGFIDTILANLDSAPTCSPRLAPKIAAIQRVFRQNPAIAEQMKQQVADGETGRIWDVENMRATGHAFLDEINAFLQGYRVLCVTTQKDSEYMWKEYAQDHQGIALRIEPNVKKDSKFQLFRPMEYREKRPAIFPSAAEYQKSSLFGDQDTWRKAALHNIVYSKTLKWQDECEYRLAIPVAPDEADWSTLPYHSDEIAELYLGLAMTPEERDDIVAKARARNGGIKIFQAARDGQGRLIFGEA